MRKKELLIELINEHIDKIDSNIVSYGSEADNEEYKKIFYRILNKINSL